MEWRVIIDGFIYHRAKDGSIYETSDLHEAVDEMFRLGRCNDRKLELRKVENYNGYISIS